ncbi:MAG: DUF507 family protein [Deltaproteobacteria bacterium]|nr:DUF507 family protein [Deltaproteobacteria bacterium]
MRLYKAKVPIIAHDIIEQLSDAEDIEVSDRDEAEQDIQAVLNEYRRLDREVTETTKDQMQARGLDYGMFGRVRRSVAEKMDLALGDDSILWMCNQILETFMQSHFIEEIFQSDAILRRKMTEILKHHMMVDDELDVEVRRHIKNLEEGSMNWDVEYAKVMEQIKRKRGLDK